MNDATPEKRSADRTRQKILDTAFAEIHWRGFQGLRIDAVLAKTGLTKGAFYHHFISKQALGYAVVEEVIASRIREVWVDTLAEVPDPLDGIEEAIVKIAEAYGPEMMTRGCPLNNLAQEMSPIDEGFRERISKVFEDWRNAIIQALERGKKNDFIRTDIDTRATADFIVAGIEGCIGLTKNERDPAALFACFSQVDRYLATLRPIPGISA